MKYRIRKQDELKASGVEWLGDIYKNWGVISIKRLIQILTDYTANGSFADLAKNVTYLDEPNFARLIRLTDIRKNFKNDRGVYINKDSYEFLKKSSLFGNEILVANVGAYSGYSFLLPEKLDFKASLAPNMFLIKFKENKVLHKFIFYVLKSNIVLDKLIQLSISAAQPKLNKDNIKSLVIPFLSLIEQQKIANFLDEKSKIFDDTISKKEKLISKLEFAKQSLISEVVTGKLKIVEQNSKLQSIKREQNELKPSGIEWMGDIPKEWEMKKLGYMFSFKNGVNTDSSNYGKGIKFINVKETINTNFIMEKDIEGSVLVSDSIIKENSVRKGDVLFNRTSETIEELALSTVYYDDKIALFGGFVIRGRQITKKLDLDFKRYCFQSTEIRKQIISYGSGSIRKNIAQTNLKNVYLFVPTITEQKQISKYLDEKLIYFDNTIEKTKQSIKKLKLAKEALISQAVTGKIEVL